jgi:hypothetical protein
MISTCFREQVGRHDTLFSKDHGVPARIKPQQGNPDNVTFHLIQRATNTFAKDIQIIYCSLLNTIFDKAPVKIINSGRPYLPTPLAAMGDVIRRNTDPNNLMHDCNSNCHKNNSETTHGLAPPLGPKLIMTYYYIINVSI